MGFKDTALVAASVLVLAVGANQVLQPTSTDEFDQQRRQGQLDHLSDADESSKGRMRDEGNDLVDAENDRRNRSVQTQAPQPRRPRVRLRLP